VIAASWSTHCWSRARSPAAPAQGLGGILLEDIAYDPEGQLLTGSLADYMVPTAGDVPEMVLIHQHSPWPLNPLGVKGVGERGAVAPPAEIANAVANALAPFGAKFNATPIKPVQFGEACSSASSPNPNNGVRYTRTQSAGECARRPRGRRNC
jgi:hypothetical protein